MEIGFPFLEIKFNLLKANPMEIFNMNNINWRKINYKADSKTCSRN